MIILAIVTEVHARKLFPEWFARLPKEGLAEKRCPVGVWQSWTIAILIPRW